MADEASVTWSLTVRKNNLSERDNGSFRVDVTGQLGPLPGAMSVPLTGRIVDFSGFITEPGLCVIKNIGETYAFNVGIYDPQTNVFYPLSEVGPGESYPLKLSRDLLEQYNDTGTGTTGPENKLMIKGIGGEAQGYVGAFER